MMLINLNIKYVFISDFFLIKIFLTSDQSTEFEYNLKIDFIQKIVLSTYVTEEIDFNSYRSCA